MEPQWSSQRQQQQPQQRPPVGLSPQQTGWSSMQQQPQQQQQQGFMQQQQMQPQQTGMLGPGMAMMQRPMATGMPMQMQPQQTGFGSSYGAPPPVPSLPRMYAQNTGYPQPMMPQATGYPGQGGSMLGSFNAVPSTFVSTFMPSNPNAQWNSGPGQYTQQQAAQAPAPLPQYFEQHNQQTMGQTAVNVQWALTADERKNYDKIFRAWDQGSGFITGQRALEVFKESGLERDDLMKVWALADRENRGKLNLAEFHVAMGLIYRKLSGNPIPDVLPQELIPPSSRDLDQSVDFLKDLLRNDTNSRSTNLDVNQQTNTNKYAKVRSFAAGASPEPTSSRKDATVYRHDDGDTRTYQSSSRHLDRRNVRFQGEDEDSELGRMKRELQSSADMLDNSRKEEAEDDDLKAELEDLQYRIRRVKDDIEYNRSGRRTEAKEQERRRLERELLFLQHEKFPEIEAKMRERERTKRSEDRSAARQRDARNSSNRYERETRLQDDNARGKADDEDDRIGYNKGSYGRSNDNEKRTRFQDDDDGARPSSRGTDSPAPAPVKAQKPASEVPPAPTPPPEAPKPASPAPSARKAQTAEERQAFIRAEAQRRVQERMRLLTGHSPSASPGPEQQQPSIDSSVSERLESEKKAAAERAKAEDDAAAEREKVRQMKLEEERLGRVKKEQQTLEQDSQALQQVSDEVTASEVKDLSATGKAAATAAREELDEEEKAIQAKEQQLKEERRKREERLKQLQAEIDESEKQERELQEKKTSSVPKQPAKKSAPPPPTSRGGKAPAPKPPVSRSVAAETSAPSPAPSAPIAPPVTPPAPAMSSSPVNEPAASASSVPAIASPVPIKPTNPFHRMNPGNAAGSPSPSFSANATASSTGKNPFFRPPTGASPAAAAPSAPPAPPAPTAPPASSRAGRTEEDWGDIKDLSNDDSSDSSDDEDSGPSTRQTRAGLADLLFGGNSSAPTSRPGSARPTTPASNAPAPPKASAAALAQLGGSPPPRSALLGAIQAGASLRKTVTSDRSKAPGAGNVIGDASPPVRAPASAVGKHNSPRGSLDESSNTQTSPETGLKPINPNRQSVDWYGGLAADTYPSPTFPSQNGQLPTMQEESEEDAALEHTQALGTNGSSEDDPEAEYNMSASIRARSLYPYEAQRPQDASFSDNLLIIAHPAKDPSNEWLYGIVPSTGAKGLLPKSYVEELALNIPAKLLYDYQGQTDDELKVQEGASVVIGEKLADEWARAIHDGKVGLVPLTYLEES